MNPRSPRVLGPPHTTILFSHHHGHNSTHGTSSVRVSGHSNPSVAQVQSSGFTPSGHRITLQAGDRIPSLHETGPAPFLDADGGPVFIGSASFGRSVHPCKIVPNVRSLEAFGILLHIKNNAATRTLSCILCMCRANTPRALRSPSLHSQCHGMGTH